MGLFSSNNYDTPKNLIKGWRSGTVDALAMIYQTMAKKMSQAGAQGDMTKDEAMMMPPPQTARDYYYEARGLVNAFHFLCSQNNIKMKIAPEQAVEWFWDSEITLTELNDMVELWMNQMEAQNIVPRRVDPF